MNLGLLILLAVIGIIFGIIGGALWLVVKIILTQRKALKDYKDGKMIKTKNSPQEKIEEELDVPKPESNNKKNNKSSKLFGKNK